MIDVVCIWNPVYRLQFIGLGGEKVIMLEGKRCIARVCVCVCPYLCLAKGNLIIPVIRLGFVGFSVVWPAVQGVVACRLHMG